MFNQNLFATQVAITQLSRSWPISSAMVPRCRLLTLTSFPLVQDIGQAISRRALQGASFTSVPQLRAAIDRFVKAYNAHATPFEWRKRVVHSVGLKRCYADLRS